MRCLRALLPAAALLTAAACQQASVLPVTAPPLLAPTSLSASAALSSSCSGCHGAIGPALPGFGHLDAEALSERLATYKYDPTGTTVMHRLARGYSDEQIEMISAYLAMGQTND